MNYLISEERLVSLINKYITHLVGDKLTLINFKYGKRWRGKDDITFFRTIADKNTFVVDTRLFGDVVSMFSLEDEWYFLFVVFADWFNSAQDLEQIEDIAHTHIRTENLN